MARAGASNPGARPGRIGRRKVLGLLGGAAAAWPVMARAQQPASCRPSDTWARARPSTESPWTAAFVQRLRELGWNEGRTIAIEYRWGEGRNERFAEAAAEFVRRKVDVIVAPGSAVAIVKHATSTIPIVFPIAGDPIGAGLARRSGDRAAMPPDCHCSSPKWPASVSNSCVSLFLSFGGWQSWPTPALPPWY